MSRVTLLDAHWSAISFTRVIQVTGLRLALACCLAGAGTLPGAVVSTNSLTPAEELASFRLADQQLKVELVASEPDVISPVAIAFDADGRLFVAEMIDYPTGPTAGRIKLLEDRDRDGRYETSSVFADSLPFPNGGHSATNCLSH